MPDDNVTREKIRQLLEELRLWGPGEARFTVQELARRFGLEPFVVSRILISEGLKVRIEDTLDEGSSEVDPNAITVEIDPVDDDVDTRVWKRRQKD